MERPVGEEEPGVIGLFVSDTFDVPITVGKDGGLEISARANGREGRFTLALSAESSALARSPSSAFSGGTVSVEIAGRSLGSVLMTAEEMTDSNGMFGLNVWDDRAVGVDLSASRLTVFAPRASEATVRQWAGADTAVWPMTSRNGVRTVDIKGPEGPLRVTLEASKNAPSLRSVAGHRGLLPVQPGGAVFGVAGEFRTPAGRLPAAFVYRDVPTRDGIDGAWSLASLPSDRIAISADRTRVWTRKWTAEDAVAKNLTGLAGVPLKWRDGRMWTNLPDRPENEPYRDAELVEVGTEPIGPLVPSLLDPARSVEALERISRSWGAAPPSVLLRTRDGKTVRGTFRRA